MESHPVPQNVTSFEFHLVGDMTLKQFIYLASGLTVAYLLFAFVAQHLPFVAYPLIFIFVVSGVAFAFLPIAERPLDHWAAAFLKAVFSPTQRSWRSSRKDITKGDPVFNKRLNIYLSSVNPADTTNSMMPLASKLSSLSQFAPATQQVVSMMEPQIQVPYAQPPSQSAKPAPKFIPPIAPTPNLPIIPPVAPPANFDRKDIQELRRGPDARELVEIVDLAKQAQGIQQKMVETEQRLDQIKADAAVPGANAATFTDKFQESVKSLQDLTRQASEISYRLAVLSRSEPTKTSSKITIVPNTKKESTGPKLILTTTANIINGVVVDANNNYIEGVIVVTHDKEGLPVRALKTNKLGQFIAATPLPNGIYTITLEKDDLVFDNLQIELEGEVLPPIKIAAKKMGV